MQFKKLFSFITVAFLFTLLGKTIVFAEINITVGYLERLIPPPPILSNLEEIPENLGIAGVELGLKDNNTTGKFLKHDYSVESRIIDEKDDFIAAAKALLEVSNFLIIKAPIKDQLALADLPEAEGALIFNASEKDIVLRDYECRGNLLHTIPSYAMLADALAQFAVKKRWKNWVLIDGEFKKDKAYATALEQSAKKFRIDIKARKTWMFNADMRRNAAQEVPLFTQDFPDHDLIVVADENHDFGRYVIYNTWLPRPIAGSEGISPVTWSAAVEQFGAVQLQNRFKKMHSRTMGSIDYAAWAAIRTIGEAVTRTNSNDFSKIRSYILSDDFELAGFKGRKLSYRKWNGQLRQPIPLTHPRAVVATAPLEGFLHKRNEMDSLGLDKPQTKCEAFNQ